MKRRGFLGFLGGAAAVAPVALNEALNGIPDVTMNRGRTGIYSAGLKSGWGDSSSTDYAGELRKRLLELTGLSADDRAKMWKDTVVHGISPDLASYRSFSASAKLHLQRSRNVDIDIEDEKLRLMEGLQRVIMR